MRIAGMQMAAVAGNVAANLDMIAQAARSAAMSGAAILITPELALTGYGAGEAMAYLAEPVDGAVIGRLAALARETGIVVVAGFAERAGDAVYNAVVCVGATPDPIVYRKSHLWGGYERALFTAGAPCAVTFGHRGITCGLLICYDVEFPENVRRLALAGADLILVPTALPAGPSGEFITRHMIATRAFENQVFLAYIDHCGHDGRFTYAGLSRIAAPDGTMLAQAGPADPALIVADIDPDVYRRSRSENAYLTDLRLPHNGL